MARQFAIFCLLGFMLLSCSYKKLEFEKSTGKYNKVRSGEKFCVNLPEDHKTNYYWGVTHDYDKKSVSYIASVFHGTYVEFNFDALAPGKTEITFSLTGYNEVKDTKTFLVEIE